MQPIDDLNRSWVRRGWGSPSPTWGLSVPPLWSETAVTFYRREQSLDEYGGIVGNPVERVVWSTVAHCEIVELRAQQLARDFASGPMFGRQWSIYANWPEENDITKVPREGDYIRFETVDGRQVNLKLKHVYANSQLADHVQAETIEFE